MADSFLGLSRQCPQCKTAAPIWDTVCIECGWRILSPTWVKFAGIFFAIVGAGIAGTLIYIMWWMAGVMLHNSDPGVKNHFTGTPLQAVLIFALLSAVAMFGLTYLAMGVWWIMRATRSALIIRLGVFGYAIVIVGFALLQWWAN